MKSLITAIIIGALLMSSGVLTTFAQKKAQPHQREIFIYLLKAGGNTDLNPVKRLVNSKSPLADALKELVKGPTEEEKNNDLISSTYGIQFVSVSLKNGRVSARFTMPESARFSGDGAPFIFEDAVTKTAMQFKGIKKVIVCLDGEFNFGDEGSMPSKKC